jgi:hypothetical protein
MQTSRNQNSVSSARFGVLNFRGPEEVNPVKAPVRGEALDTQRSKKEVPVQLDGGGEILVAVSKKDSSKNIAPSKANIEEIDKAMELPKNKHARGRSTIHAGNKDPNHEIPQTKNFTPVVKGGVLPKLGNNATVVADGTQGAIRMTGKNAKVISRNGSDFRNTRLNGANLTMDTDGSGNLDNAQILGGSLNTNALLNGANMQIAVSEASSNIHLATGMAMPNSSVTGNVHDHGHHTEEAGESYVAFSGNAPRLVHSVAAVQHASHDALREVHHPLSAGMIAHLNQEAEEGMANRSQRARKRDEEMFPVPHAA